MSKSKVFTDFNASTFADVLLFIKKAENFRVERKLLRKERLKRERLKK